MLGIHLLWILGCSAIVVLTGGLDLGAGGGEAWLIIQEEMVERFDAFNAATSLLPGAQEDNAVISRVDEDWKAATAFIYTSPGDNMLTPQGLSAVKTVWQPALAAT